MNIKRFLHFVFPLQVNDEDIESQPPSQATTPILVDPLTHTTGLMTRSRTKKMQDALATLILEVQADFIIYSHSLGLDKAFSICSVTSGLHQH